MYGGIPSSFNMLTFTPTASNWLVTRLMYLGFAPFVFANGTTDFTNSLTDWMSHNANYTQWTFNVRPGTMWSNGQPVTANDILSTYSSKFALNTTVDFLNFHQEVARSYALNDSAAVFVLNKSDAHFPDLAGQNVYTAVYPPSFISSGVAYSGINGTDVGDGPFYVSNYAQGQSQMTMLRNPYYKPLPAVCKVIINFVEASSQVPTYLLAGTSDFGGVPPGSVSSLTSNPHMHLYDTQAVRSLTMMYNLTEAPFNQLAFRQALAYGVNQSEIQSQAYRGYFTMAYAAEGGIPPESTLWYNANQQKYSYNVSKALALLNSIGIKKGSDGYLQYSNGTDVSLTIFADNSITELTLSGGIVTQNLQKLGFKVTFDSVPISTIIGYTYSNTNNIWDGIIMDQSGGPVFGLPYLDALPSWQVYEPLAPYPTWMAPANIEAEYSGNLSIVQGTDNSSVIKGALLNIQALGAQYLPNIHLGYPDAVNVYSTQNWVNWPNFITYGLDTAWNDRGFAQLQPVGSQQATSNTSTSSSSSTQATSSLSSSSSPTTSGSGLNATYIYAAIAVIVIIVIAAVAVLMMRRPPRPQ